MTPSGAAATGMTFGAGRQASEPPLTARGVRASYASPWAVVVRVSARHRRRGSPAKAPTGRPSLHAPLLSRCVGRPESEGARVLWIRTALRIQAQNALSGSSRRSRNLSLKPVAEHAVCPEEKFVEVGVLGRHTQPTQVRKYKPATEPDGRLVFYHDGTMANPSHESRCSRPNEPSVTARGVFADNPLRRCVGHELKVHTAIMPRLGSGCTGPNARQSRGCRAPSAADTDGPHCRDSSDRLRFGGQRLISKLQV